MSNLTKIQEVYFDLCDLDYNNNLKSIKIKGFQEFKNLHEFIEEQKLKITELESALKEYEQEDE